MKTKQLIKIGIFAVLLYLFMYYWSTVSGFLRSLLGAAVPLLIGCVIAYLVNILMGFYERHYFPKKQKGILAKTRRPVCILGAFLTLLAIIVLIISLVVPQLISCVETLVSAIPGLIEKGVAWAASLHLFSEENLALLQEFDWQSRIGEIARVLTSGVGDVMGIVVKIISAIVSGTVTVFLAVIFSIYLLCGKDKIRMQIKRAGRRYIRPGWYRKIAYVVRVVDDSFHRYIVGQCTEAVILGLLCTGFMLLLKLPYATMIGALIAFTALIPVAGAYIGAILGALMILAVSPLQALFFLVLIVVLQQMEGNLIYPRVVGASIGLPGIWVLAAVTIGGGIFGVFGMLLGVPLAAATYRLIREDVNGTTELHKA
ncbi:MAG: AI-2E family transporter [Clostridia bacterium]|nr:AI-2E family transporter [Oscillospiraceae bacterium]MBQ7032998.1 AI-2E family transporter [Clostridia bacterium]